MLDNDINTNLINWEDLFWTAVNEFVPHKRINDKFTPPWIDREVKVLCRRKDRASRKALRTKDSRDSSPFKSLRRSCKSLIRSKYNAYLRQLADNIQDNPKKFWSFYSVKTRTRKLPLAIKKDVNSNSLVTDTLEKANLFNNYFNSVFSKPCKEPLPPGLCPIVPPLRELSNVVISVNEVESILKNLDPSKSPGPDGLTSRLLKEIASDISCPITELFNKSLNNGIFPTKLKDSNLTPVFKSGQKDVVTNYTGIALLPVLSKVLERCVHSRILNMIKPYLSPSQRGFRRYRSCVTQLLQYVHNLATSLDAREQIDSIYLDMEQAFFQSILA